MVLICVFPSPVRPADCTIVPDVDAPVPGTPAPGTYVPIGAEMPVVPVTLFAAPVCAAPAVWAAFVPIDEVAGPVPVCTGDVDRAEFVRIWLIAVLLACWAL
jgi:hypothetical protein